MYKRVVRRDRQRPARQVVGGRPQAAGADDEIATRGKPGKGRDVGIQVIRDSDVLDDRDSQIDELLREPA